MSESTTVSESNPLHDTQAKRRWVNVVVNILLVSSVLLNLLLALRVRSLEGSLLGLRAEKSLSLGTLVPPIEARDIDDRPAKVAYLANEPPTVLYIFTPQCQWCANNLENIRTLAARAGRDYRFVGLSLSPVELRDYVKKNDFGFPVYSDMSYTFYNAYKVGGTPSTLVISPEGRVLKNWRGAYMDDLKREVEQYFKVELPGIRE
jgi:peroxiredoxin